MKLHLFQDGDNLTVHYIEPCCNGTRETNPHRTSINSPVFLSNIDPKFEGRISPFLPHIYTDGIGVVRFCPYCGKVTEVIESHIPPRFKSYAFQGIN